MPDLGGQYEVTKYTFANKKCNVVISIFSSYLFRRRGLEKTWKWTRRSKLRLLSEVLR